MFMKRAFSATLLALCPAVVGPAFAHDTWMTPERGSVSPGTALTLDMTSGMAFPALDHAIDPDRIERAFCRLKDWRPDTTSSHETCTPPSSSPSL